MVKTKCVRCQEGYINTLMYNIIDEFNITKNLPEQIHKIIYDKMNKKNRLLYKVEKLICMICKGKTHYLRSDI